jgi:hypothetical protein
VSTVFEVALAIVRVCSPEVDVAKSLLPLYAATRVWVLAGSLREESLQLPLPPARVIVQTHNGVNSDIGVIRDQE